MSELTSSRLVLTSVNQVITLARNHPELIDKVTKLSQLRGMELSVAPKKSCNCGTKQNFTTHDVNKQHTESMLSSMNADDFMQIKNVLGLRELCYYKRNVEQNKLDLVCL